MTLHRLHFSLPVLLHASLTLLAAGCVTSHPAFDRDEARRMGGRAPDGTDLCASEGWYGDGVCDTFCPDPDPDCSTCPDPSAVGVRYISSDPAECAAAFFACEPDETLFSDECGCGCVGTEPVCPDESEPGVTYVSRDPICHTTDWGCPAEGDRPVEDECGCYCVSEPAPTCPDPADPNVQYASEDPAECARIDFACEPGWSHFQGVDPSCGCGCVRDPDPSCPDPADPRVSYASQDPEVCGVLDFLCREGWSHFGGVDSSCGCGCIANDATCEDARDPAVRYISDDPSVCARIDFACPAGERGFENDCGCGCVAPAPVCPDPSDPSVEYFGYTRETCSELASFACDGVGFDDLCGCGCIHPIAGDCPSAEDPTVTYRSTDVAECEELRAIDVPLCDASETAFYVSCGCGCIAGA